MLFMGMGRCDRIGAAGFGAGFFVVVRAGSGDPALQSGVMHGGPCSSRSPDRERVKIWRSPPTERSGAWQ